jgi:hypothetical protein
MVLYGGIFETVRNACRSKVLVVAPVSAGKMDRVANEMVDGHNEDVDYQCCQLKEAISRCDTGVHLQNQIWSHHE